MDDSNHITFRTILKSAAVIVGLIVLIGYVMFQARFLLIGPQIVLIEELDQHHNSRTVTLTGQTYNISHLWLNNRSIYTDANGRFEEALVLENGYTIATLQAEDRYGRITKVVRPFVYTPASFIQ